MTSANWAPPICVTFLAESELHTSPAGGWSLGTVRLRARINRRVKVPSGRKHWPLVAEGNCVVERRGGEQPEANVQSISKTMLNSIRPDTLASLPFSGDAGDRMLPRTGDGDSDDLHRGGSVRGHSRDVLGVWRWNGWKLERRKSGIAIRERMEFMAEGDSEGDRALVVAKKQACSLKLTQGCFRCILTP